MGTFWLLILTPIVAATLAAFLATSQPPELVRHGLVIGPSSWSNLGLAIGGGAGGVFAVGAVTFLTLLGRYLRSGDMLWQATDWGPGNFPFGTFFLRSKVVPALQTSTLGRYECWLRTPDGKVRRILDGSYGDSGDAVHASFLELSPGDVHVRWYVTQGKPRFVERARATIRIDKSEFQLAGRVG